MWIARRMLPASTALAALSATLALCASAQAAAPAPHWLMISQPAPTYFHAGDTTDFYWVVAMNDGGAPSAGKITFKDTLPAGLTVTAVNASAESEAIQRDHAGGMECTTSGSPQTVECTSENAVPIGDRVVARITVEVPNGTVGPLHNSASIEGGGAPEAAATANSTPVVAPSTVVPYGASLVGEATQEDGLPASQAGSHPFAFSTLFATNVGQVNAEEEGGEGTCTPPGSGQQPGCAELTAASKDVEVQLPPGMVGDPLAVPRCTQEQFQAPSNDGCPASTQVGSAQLTFFGSGTQEQFAPVYDVEPPPGQPAELGFTVGGEAKVPMFFHVRSDGDYGLTADFRDIANFDTTRIVSLMIWGVPAIKAHDPMRESKDNGCESGVKEGLNGCPSEALPAQPFLSMPSQCTGQPLDLPLSTDAWEAPGVMVKGEPEATLTPLSGCEALSFAPEIGVGATTRQAGAPAGYQVDLTVPQHESPEELATPDVRDVEVTLPEGTLISPSAANGLVACTDAQFGKSTGKVGECPQASKIGAVTIHTPLLSTPLEGSVYLGQPECGASGICSPQQAAEGRMVRLFIEARMPEPPPGAERPALLVKLAGRTQIDQSTGRLTTVFTANPQLPFEELEVALKNGPGSPLTNPASCGPVTASAHLTAWSALFNGEGAVTDPGSQATIASAPLPIEGCSPSGFSPSLVAGMSGSTRGGSFGSFGVLLSRPDGQQDLGRVTLRTPPGLAAILAKVPLCDEAQANAGSCGAASQIGEATVSVGSGSRPYTIHGGRVFLTGPYGGGPFGLSLVVPAEAGPFRLAGVNGTGGEGDGSVVIRGSIKIDPHTAAITIATNPPPTSLNGIPLHIQRVLVSVDRQGFTFNPTNCNAMSVEDTIASSAGAAVSSRYPFQATDCASLPFKPGFFVSTKARHTHRNGAYLRVRVTSGRGQANIRSVFVELPKVLPSRVSTLKLACAEAQFARNPAGCPRGSFVGAAVARTPVLPVLLTGPAIFVSHGGAAFPDLDVVLQGDGVTIVLSGNTNIRKGITSSSFKSVPDVPVNSFQLTLPTGPHSALSANGNLCTTSGKQHARRRTLRMPTTITGQNGAVIKKTTKITVKGCPKTHKAAGAKKKRRR